MLHRDLVEILENKGLLVNVDLHLAGDKYVSSVEHDSRRVQKDSVFVAIDGYETDGHKFIKDAVAGGAVSIVVSRETQMPLGTNMLLVNDTRRALAILSAHFYGYPSEGMHLLGITGTNGKTTTTHLIESIYKAAGKKTGLIGTIHNKINERELTVRHTTPDSLELQRLLREMRDEGVTHLAMEVSSHALELERIFGCSFDVAVFTNLTQDHLDFHGNMRDYLAAKTKLFLQAKKSVINADDPAGRILMEQSVGNIYTYSLKGKAYFVATDIVLKSEGVSFTVEWENKRATIDLRLTGLFNVYNGLAAFSAGVVQGFDPKQIIHALEGVKNVPGRFEQVNRGQDFSVIVDYAHTPDGLENVLRTARAITDKKLITVFGCGGDRDRTKRPLMGEIAARYSDFSVLTSDNPRTESPEGIISDVEQGMLKVPGAKYAVEVDRKAAIGQAISKAGGGDLVLIAGKGHETYQVVGGKHYPFDDREVAALALNELLGKEESHKC